MISNQYHHIVYDIVDIVIINVIQLIKFLVRYQCRYRSFCVQFRQKCIATYHVGYQSLTVILCTISTSYRGTASNVTAKLEGKNIDEK